jgi:hypothetical protein
LASKVLARGPLIKLAADGTPPILPVAELVIVNKLMDVVVSMPDVSVSVADDRGPVRETPFVLFMVRLFNWATLEGMVIPGDDPPKTSVDAAVVARLLCVPAIAGPFKIRVLPATANVPLVSVSVPFIVVAPHKETPPERLIVRFW